MLALEHAWKRIVETCAEGVCAVDPDGLIAYVNPRGAEMLGYPEDTFVGRSLLEYVAPESRAVAQAGLDPVRAGARGVYELALIRADGTRLHVIVSASSLPWSDRRNGLLAMVTDVTARVRAEEALRRSEEEFRALYERTPVMVQSIDPDGRLLSVSDAWCEGLGYTREEVIGRHSIEFLTPESKSYAQNVVLPEYFETGSCKDVPYAFVRKDGAHRDFLLSATAERDRSGRLIRSLAVLIDVTERKRTETALRESEARFQTLARVAPVGIFLTDAKGVTLYVNERWCEMAGRSPFESMGTGWTRALHPEDRERVMSGWDHAVAAGLSSRDEYRFIRPDGGVTWVVGQAVPELAPDGTLLGHVGTITDITDHKRIEDDLHRHRAELEDLVAERTAELAAANRELETFAYSVSHDLRAPLRAIDGYAHLLEEDNAAQLDEKARAYLGRMRVGARRATQIVEDLLRLARVTRAELRREDVDLSAMAGEIAQALSSAAPERAVEVVVADGVVVYGDPALLRILMENLMGNAFKFTSHHDTARIEVGASPSGAVFVRDDGAGFDPARVSESFQPFRRLHGLDEFEGTGIGLATVARVVDRHGGHVWAEGAPERGATFWFRV